MKTEDTKASLQDNRSGMFEALRELDPTFRYAIGLISCAVAAYYIPSIIIALTGVWVNNLTVLNLLLISVAILIVQNLIGNYFKKILLVGIVFAVLSNIYAVVSMLRIAAHPTVHDWWMMFFFATTSYPLNAWLLLKFKAAANLN